MQLFPIKTKYKKQHRRRRQLFQIENNYNYPLKNTAAIKAISSFRLLSSQIEASRKVIAKYIRKRFKNKLRFCVFPDLPITKKASGVRMGKGKGNVDYWCLPIKQGRILFEINKIIIPKSIIFKAFSLIKYKLPGLIKIIL